MRLNIERISAVTFKVASMTNSVRFYRDVLGMKSSMAGKMTGFRHSAPKTTKGQSSIWNRVAR